MNRRSVGGDMQHDEHDASMSAVAMQGVSKSYGSIAILHGFNLDLPRGSATALLGPSGSGKTTIMRLLAGLDAPDGGRIALGGRVVSGAGILVPPWERRIGMVFQDLALWPHMRVRGQLSFVLPHLDRRARQARVDELLVLMELTDMARALPAELSGGEQQRLAIARALAPRPPILLLDEPFGSLDARLREVVAQHLVELKAEGVTLLIATHHASDIEPWTDATVRTGE